MFRSFLVTIIMLSISTLSTCEAQAYNGCDPDVTPDCPVIILDPSQFPCYPHCGGMGGGWLTQTNPDVTVATVPDSSSPSPYRWQVLVPAIVIPVVVLLTIMVAGVMYWRRTKRAPSTNTTTEPSTTPTTAEVQV